MAKKEKISLQHSDDLEAVDAELSAAMEALDNTNERVIEILQAYAPPPEPVPADPEATDETPGKELGVRS